MERVSGCLSYLLSRLGLIGGTFRPGSPQAAPPAAAPHPARVCLLAVRVFLADRL